MALATRVFDGVAVATYCEAVCQAVWPGTHAIGLEGRKTRAPVGEILNVFLESRPGRNSANFGVSI